MPHIFCRHVSLASKVVLATTLLSPAIQAAEAVVTFPLGRNAYFIGECVSLGFRSAAGPMILEVVGKRGIMEIYRGPAQPLLLDTARLAPGEYQLKLNGQFTGDKFTITSVIRQSAGSLQDEAIPDAPWGREAMDESGISACVALGASDAGRLGKSVKNDLWFTFQDGGGFNIQCTGSFKPGETGEVIGDIAYGGAGARCGIPINDGKVKFGFNLHEVDPKATRAIDEFELVSSADRIDAFAGTVVLGNTPAQSITWVNILAGQAKRTVTVPRFKDVAVISDKDVLCARDDRIVRVSQDGKITSVIEGIADAQRLSLDHATGKLYVWLGGKTSQVAVYGKDFHCEATFGRALAAVEVKTMYGKGKP